MHDGGNEIKNLNDAAPRWLGILRALAGEPGFELARKEAIESGEDLADQAKRLLTEQIDYFNEHKDEKGQERAEAIASCLRKPARVPKPKPAPALAAAPLRTKTLPPVKIAAKTIRKKP